MSDAIDKTKKLKRKFVSIDLLEANPFNPNEMTEAEFNMLYDNIGKVGITDPIFCVNHPDKEGMFRIIGGEHRWEVAKLYGFKEVPITLVDSADFSEDQQKFQIVMHNIIHGNMSTEKFMKLYESLSEQYTNEVASEMFGFTEQGDFEKLIHQTKKSLPKELQDSFDAAKGDLKTIDDLSILLTRLFSTYGDTLPYGYMIFDFGGMDSVWLRMSNGDLNNFNKLVEHCKLSDVTLDGVVSNLLQLIASDDVDALEVLSRCINNSDKVVLNLGEDELPTLDFLDDYTDTK